MADTSFGIMCASGSPAIAEAVAASGVDWLCIDAQHGPITYDTLGNILAACSSHKAKVIVRVGGPTDKFGIQQALDLGAHGVMVPLVNSRADAEMAVSHCLFPPQGQRSVAYPVRAVYHKGVGGPGLSRYLKEANSEVEVWLQVETKSCFESMDEVLSVPGITSAFLGPCDLGITYGYHVSNDYDIGAMIASKELSHVYDDVLQALRPSACSSIAAASGAAADIQLQHGDIIKFGSLALHVLATPGHTSGCLCFHLPPAVAGAPGLVFTGDALLIRGCGRTDFQQGDAALLYEGIHAKLFTLPYDTLVYPGHDYKGRTCSSIAEEKAHNPRLSKSKEEFVEIMNNLGLPYPKQIDRALPANLEDGAKFPYA